MSNNFPLEYCTGINPYLGGPLLEEEKMSFCCTLIYNGAIYLCADSMLTTIFDDGRPTEKNDNYVKIAVIPDTNIAVIMSGLSKFDNTTVEELVHVVKAKNCFDAIIELERFLVPFKLAAQSATYYTVAGTPLNSSGGFGVIVATTYETRYADRENTIYAAGPDYVIDEIQKIHDSRSYLDELKTTSPQDYLNKLATHFVEVSNQRNKNIGGPIRILKLTPDGAEWLQNKPE